MPIIVEYMEDKMICKYKLDEYYSDHLKTFLQSIIQTNLLDKCTLSTSSNEAYYNLSFLADSVCTLKEFLLNNSIYARDSRGADYASSSSYSSLEYSEEEDEEEEDDYIHKDNLFSYNQSLMLIGCLSTQLSTLRRNRLTFFQLNLDSIFVFNKNIFIMVDPDMITSISNSGIMTFLYPIKSNISSFHCPEIANYNVLPFNCHCNCVYYCFASLVYYCMFNDFIPMVNRTGVTDGLDVSSNSPKRAAERDDHDSDLELDLELELDLGIDFETSSSSSSSSLLGINKLNELSSNDDNIFSKQEEMIKRLYGTKLYYFLRRCLEPKGDRRKLFYI